MKHYRIFDHPSDVGIISEGKNIKEAFENTAYGMMDMMYDLSKVQSKEKFNIKVDGEDTGSLLINWLNELVYLKDAKKIIFSKFKINEISDKMLSADVFGEKIDTGKHKTKLYIKATTYNQLELLKHKDKYRIRVIFDV